MQPQNVWFGHISLWLSNCWIVENHKTEDCRGSQVFLGRIFILLTHNTCIFLQMTSPSCTEASLSGLLMRITSNWKVTLRKLISECLKWFFPLTTMLQPFSWVRVVWVKLLLVLTLLKMSCSATLRPTWNWSMKIADCVSVLRAFIPEQISGYYSDYSQYLPSLIYPLWSNISLFYICSVFVNQEFGLKMKFVHQESSCDQIHWHWLVTQTELLTLVFVMSHRHFTRYGLGLFCWQTFER